MARLSLSLIIFSVCLTASLVHLLVPPKTPVLSGFEPAAIGTYRELVCDASQPDAGIISYKWYRYVPTKAGGNTWDSSGPIGTSQKYIFNPVTEKRKFYQGRLSVPISVSGKYKCRATNSAGTRDSEWGDLYVFTPCSLYTVSVSPAKPAIGSTFIVKCYIPNPSGISVMWTKQTDSSSITLDAAVANAKGCHVTANARYNWSSCSPQSVSSKTKTFNLQVTNAQTSDFGYWICKDIGLSCRSDPVSTVQAQPGTPKITGFPVGPLVQGTQVNLKCVASPPGDAYDWYKDNTKLTTSLTYDFIVKKERAGVYKCVARNTAGSATSRPSNKTLIVSGPPLTPCCLKRVNASTVYVTLTFKSNFNGGLVQTFTIEYRKYGVAWRVGVEDIADPGFGQDVIQRVSGLERDMGYELRVKSVNGVGASGNEDVIRVETKAFPIIKLTIDREGNIVTAAWTHFERPYTKVQIKYCQRDTSNSACYYHTLADPTKPNAAFAVKEETKYVFYLEVFDGADRVFRSAPVTRVSGINGWMVVALLLLITFLAAGIALGVVMYRRSLACFADRRNAQPSTNTTNVGDVVEIGNVSVIHDPDYMDVRVQNRAFDDVYERPTVNANSNPGGGPVPGVTENQYAALDMLDTTPDVVASQETYEDLRPYNKNENLTEA